MLSLVFDLQCCKVHIKQETAYGLLSPPLGSGRLKAVEMVAALARLGAPPAEEALISAELLPRCMALFLQYPFNNLLHHQVWPRINCVNLPFQLLMLSRHQEHCESLVLLLAVRPSMCSRWGAWGK